MNQTKLVIWTDSTGNCYDIALNFRRTGNTSRQGDRGGNSIRSRDIDINIR